MVYFFVVTLFSIAHVNIGLTYYMTNCFKHAGKQLFANAQQMDSITWIILLLYEDDMVLIAEFADRVVAALQ
jgi:hypothetical protein